MAKKRNQKDEKKEDRAKSVNHELREALQNYNYLLQSLMNKDRTIQDINWRLMIHGRYVDKLGGTDEGLQEVVKEWQKEMEDKHKEEEAKKSIVGVDGKPLDEQKELIV